MPLLIADLWLELLVTVAAAVLGWLGRSFTPSRKPAGARPAPRR